MVSKNNMAGSLFFPLSPFLSLIPSSPISQLALFPITQQACICPLERRCAQQEETLGTLQLCNSKAAHDLEILLDPTPPNKQLAATV